MALVVDKSCGCRVGVFCQLGWGAWGLLLLFLLMTTQALVVTVFLLGQKHILKFKQESKQAVFPLKLQNTWTEPLYSGLGADKAKVPFSCGEKGLLRWVQVKRVSGCIHLG